MIKQTTFDWIIEELIEYGFTINPEFKAPKIDILSEGFVSKSVDLTTDNLISVIFCKFGTANDDMICMLGNLCKDRFPYETFTIIEGLHLYSDRLIDSIFKKYGIIPLK